MKVNLESSETISCGIITNIGFIKTERNQKKSSTVDLWNALIQFHTCMKRYNLIIL